MNALFQLCVPAVSGGALPQTFPPELVVELTAEERAENGVANDAHAFRIKSEHGFILLEFDAPYCSVVTADGEPADTVSPFLQRLKVMKGVVFDDRNSETGHDIAGRIPLNSDKIISVLLSTRKADDAAGFYGSASMWGKKD